MKAPLILTVCLVWTVGFSQNVPLNPFGVPFKPKQLDVKWDDKSNALPQKVWAYDLLPNTFSKQFISSVANICGLNETNKTFDGTNGIDFDSPDKSKHLGFLYSLGIFDFKAKDKPYAIMSRAQGVPDRKEAQALTLKYLSRLGIHESDLEDNETNAEPRLMVLASRTSYETNGIFATNIYKRKVVFRRKIDGIDLIGIDDGGSGEITYGENGTVIEFRMSWAKVKRSKAYRSPTPEMLIGFIREGKAVQGPISMNEIPIDWSNVKLLKVHKEAFIYCSGVPLEKRNNTLAPLVALWTTAIMEDRSINVEIDCPFFDGE